VASAVAVSACASTTRPSTSADKTRAKFEHALATFDQLQTRPFACAPRYIASPDGYIVELENWAEESGLRRPGSRVGVLQRVGWPSGWGQPSPPGVLQATGQGRPTPYPVPRPAAHLRESADRPGRIAGLREGPTRPRVHPAHRRHLRALGAGRE